MVVKISKLTAMGTKGKRRRFSASFKSKVAIEAARERATLAELGKKYQLHPNQISQWKQQLLTTAEELFEEHSGKEKEQQEALIDELYKKIGQYQIELDWLKKKSGYERY
jgi:transposase